MELGRRFLDGFFLAVMVVAFGTLHTGFSEIIGATTKGFATLGGVLSGQAGSNPFYKTPQ